MKKVVAAKAKKEEKKKPQLPLAIKSTVPKKMGIQGGLSLNMETWSFVDVKEGFLPPSS